MKKLLLLFALLIFACSSDDSSDSDNNNNIGNGPLVLSITTINPDNYPSVATDTYTYDGNKLESVTQSGNPPYNTIHTNYIVYANDRVSRIDRYTSNDSEAPTLTSEINFSYDSQGRVISMINTLALETVTNTISYGSNGSATLTEVVEFYDSTGNVWDVETSTFNIHFDNNDNIDEIIGTGDFTDDGNYNEITYNYEYDNYNSPFKNVVGLNWVLLLSGKLWSSEPQPYYFNNNSVSQAISSSAGESGSVNAYYDYNQGGYPRQIVVQVSNGYESTIEIQYSN